MRVLVSASPVVHENLALEEWLVDHFDEAGPTLLFYVDGPAVVVGKNQNPWRECDVARMQREGVALGRRISGGGAVYHDPGNLNYALVLPRAEYAQRALFERLCSALRAVGIAAGVMGSNSLGAEGRKFSGHAFCFRGGAALHHGTLLLQSDLDRLRRALRPALAGIETRAIASNPARVLNLGELDPSLTVDRLRDLVTVAFAGRGAAAAGGHAGDEALVAKHRSWAWLYGHTPAFDWTHASADVQLRVHVEKGLIASALAAWCRDREEQVVELDGCPFTREAMGERLSSSRPDVAALLRTVDF